MKFFTLVIFLFSINAWSFDFSHKSFDDLLKKIVSYKEAQTLVDYKSLKNDPTVLNTYLESISKVTEKEFSGWSRADQLAFLINAYNALTLKLIIDHLPVKSIKKIGGFFSSPWKQDFFILFGEKTNLDHIEHGLIRPNYGEPRIHFAVNCASIGCPNLQSFAFTGALLEQQLQESAKSFLLDKNKNFFGENTLHLSKIFKWYGNDFIPKYGNFRVFIADLITANKKEQELIKSGKIKTKYLSYDWNLNEK